MDLHELIQLWQRRFLATTALFILLLSGFILLARYEQDARENLADLTQAGAKLSLVKASTVEMKQILTTYRGFLHSGDENKSSEALLFSRLDDIKAMFPNSQFTIAVPTEQPEGVSVPFSIKIPQGNYTDFLNALAFMQSRIFPFVSVRTITIGYDQPAKGVVGYKIDGIIVTPTNGKRTGSP